MVPRLKWRNDGEERRGRLVAICGFDGSGKTTQIERLVGALRREGREVVSTRQPTDWYRSEPTVRAYLDHGGGPEYLHLISLLAAADRRRHVIEVIDPALRRGATVVTDRYVYSSLAYFEVRGLPLDFVADINADLPRPDIGIYLDVPAPTLHARIVMRDGGALKKEERDVGVIRLVQAAFMRWRHELDVVDGSAAADDVHREICSLVALKAGEVLK